MGILCMLTNISDKFMDLKKGSIIFLDIIAKLYAGPRTQLDSMTKGIAGSIIPPGLTTKNVGWS